MPFSYNYVNILTNAFRSFVACIGFMGIVDALTLHIHVSRKTGILMFVCGITLLALNIEATAWDVWDTQSCAGRSVSLYILSYISQLCLDFYQTNIVYIFVRKDRKMQIAAIFAFACRVISLIVALTQYFDPEVRGAGMCTTGYPTTMLAIEKAVLLCFNCTNIGLLVYTGVKMQRAFSQGISTGIIKLLISQEGYSLILSIALGSIFVAATLILKPIGGWAYSLTAALGNGISCLVLHLQLRLNVQRTRLRNETTTKSAAATAKRIDRSEFARQMD